MDRRSHYCCPPGLSGGHPLVGLVLVFCFLAWWLFSAAGGECLGIVVGGVFAVVVICSCTLGEYAAPSWLDDCDTYIGE